MTVAQVGAPASELSLDDAPLDAVPLDLPPLDGVPPGDVPLDIVRPLEAPDPPPLGTPEDEPAPVEPDVPPPDDVPHSEPQLCSAHCTTPLQFTLVQLDAALHELSADEHMLWTQALHAVVAVIPATTEIKSIGLLHPLVVPSDPAPEPPPELAPPALPDWFAVVGGCPIFPEPLPLQPIVNANPALNELAITAVLAATPNIPTSYDSNLCSSSPPAVRW